VEIRSTHSLVTEEKKAISFAFSGGWIPDNAGLTIEYRKTEVRVEGERRWQARWSGHDLANGLEGLEKDLLRDLVAEITHKDLEGGAIFLLRPRGGGGGSRRVRSPRDLDGLRVREKREISWSKNKNSDEIPTFSKITRSLRELRAYSADLWS
jgi:hypothetical protein